jgi:hypothetical protein
MAVVIESVSSQASYTAVTDIGSSGTFLVTKPTGLAVGDVLLALTSVEGASSTTPPGGWSTGTVPLDLGRYTDYFYKTADAGDVAASNYTFATNSDTAEYGYACYRLSGAVTTADPIIQTRTVSTDDTPTSISESFASSITPPDGTGVIIFVGKDSQTSTGTTCTLSDYAITGGSITFTERMDEVGSSGIEDGAAIADGVLATSSTLTGITMTASGSKTPETLLYVNVLFIYPQQDASTAVGFVSATNTAFAPVGSAGTSLTLGLTSTGNTAFAPTGRATTPTQWANETKPSTTWVNDTL